MIRILKPLLMGALSALGLFLTPLAAAPPDILFIGNSFTMGETASVPVIFDRLAIAGGNEDPNTVMRAALGRNFQFHTTDATSQAALVSRPWTYVVLQNFSTEPTHIGNVGNHLYYGDLLYKQVMTHNPAARVVLFETWSRAARHPLITGTSTYLSFQSTAQMQAELRENYTKLADLLNASYPNSPTVTVAPVGDAWENAGGLRAESDPYFADLHGNDDYHGNDNGYYLAAATIYATIYQKSPEGLHLHPAVKSLNLRLTVPPLDLERVAWDTLTQSVAVQILTQPQSAAVAENQSVTFTASVRGSVPYQVQWFRNGEEIPGATGLSLTVPNVSSSLNGTVYTVKVSNFASNLVSSPATLTVITNRIPVPILDDPRTVTLQFPLPLSPEPSLTPRNFTVVYQGRTIRVDSSALSVDGKKLTLFLENPIGPGFAVGLPEFLTDLSGSSFSTGSVIVSRADTSSSLKILVDFGANDYPTGAANDPFQTWNNVDLTVGLTDNGVLHSLLGHQGTPTGVRLEMIRRFNGANTSGYLAPSGFPVSVSRDSLFGNTETFVGQANVFPAFRLAGLNPQTPYTLTFYASRIGVTDNRTTLYTVTGRSISSTRLDAANNIDTTSSLSGIYPTSGGELTIELSPAPQNNNSHHFTYLGALILSDPSNEKPRLHRPVSLNGHLILDWSGGGRLESSPNLHSSWTPVSPAPTPPFAERTSGKSRFYRLSYDAP